MVRLFAHRGLASKDIDQNSIASLNNAYKNNFRAIEFDIWFVKGELLVVHDKPKEIAKLPRLSDYFLLQNEMIYWLDFKNLDQNNALSALKIAAESISKAGVNLKNIYFAPFIVDYKVASLVFAKIREVFGENVQIMAFCKELKNEKESKNLRDFLITEKINHLSIFYKLIDKKLIKLLGNIEYFAWTINDKKIFEKLSCLGIKNFATDIDIVS